MRKMGFHFHRHGRHDYKSAHFHGLNKRSRWLACSRRVQGQTEHDARGKKNHICSEHHNHHPHNFQTWCSGDWKRVFHHGHHGHNHQSHHGHHAHFQCHGHHQRCSRPNVEERLVRRVPCHSFECCSNKSQHKACQTDASQEEALQSDNSIGTGTEATPAST